MSQYKISKARLAQLIKEEYQSLQEDNALTRNINRWSEEGKDIPLERTVGRGERSDQLDAILSASTDIGNLQDVISYFVMKADAADVDKWLEGRIKHREAELSPAQRTESLNSKSVGSIRDMIRQELTNL